MAPRQHLQTEEERGRRAPPGFHLVQAFTWFWAEARSGFAKSNRSCPAASPCPKPEPDARQTEVRLTVMVPILRKEVIQPQVPLRLPCYDFTPVADLTVVGYAPCGFVHRLKVKPTPMV